MNTIYLILKNYFKKTFFLSEIVVALFYAYVFIYKMSDFTFGADTFLITLNVSLMFSCLLVSYRLFVYEVKETGYFLSLSGKTKYYIQRFLIVFFYNVIFYFILLLVFYKLKTVTPDISNILISSIPILILNIFISTSIGLFFSPVVLSIHQVIHGVFFVSVGINFSAIGNLFSNIKFINLIFKTVSYIFPPFEQLIKTSINPVYDFDHNLIIVWGMIYGIIFLALGFFTLKNKELNFTEDGTILHE